MKSLKNIAQIVLERRSRLTHVIMPGDLTAQLGSEGMQEALRRNWIEPDYDTGALKVNGNLGVVQEMEAILEKECEVCHKEKCECDGKPEEKQESQQEVKAPATVSPRSFAMGHSHRLHEFAAPGSGQPDPANAPAVAPQTQPLVPPQNRADINRSSEHMVGEDVVVAEEGKTYQGKVQSKNPDGTYVLSFGQNKPGVTRHYRKEEIQSVRPGDTQLVK